MLFYVVTLLSFLIPISLQDSYFCDLKCNDEEHTVCKYEPCLPHDNCGDKYKMLQLDDEERTYITTIHNDFRQRVASGEDKRGGNNKAANMRAFSYSKEVEFVAQCWANRCNQNGAHDRCRAIKEFALVGQNMYMTSVNSESVTKDDLMRAVEAWYEEIIYTTANIIKSYTHGSSYGHFTQVVWAKTTYVGCGRTRYGNSDSMFLLIICNYAIAGNFKGESVYKFGEKCSDCDDVNCNDKYNALCGRIRTVEEDKWEPPFKLGASTSSVMKIVLFVFVIVNLFCA